MSRLEILNRIYDRYMNDLKDYSEDWKFEIPRRGYERQWEEAKEIADEVEEIISQLEAINV